MIGEIGEPSRHRRAAGKVRTLAELNREVNRFG